jgi:hypothetical protein
MNQPKLIWGCEGRGLELNTEVFKVINVEKSSLSVVFFAKILFYFARKVLVDIF